MNAHTLYTLYKVAYKVNLKYKVVPYKVLFNKGKYGVEPYAYS